MHFPSRFVTFAFSFIFPLFLLQDVHCESKAKKPNIPELIQRATEHFSKGELETSHNLFRTILKWDPDNTAVLYQHATCLTALGKLPQARDNWSKLITLKPNYHKAYTNRASIHLKEGNFEEVENDLKVASKYAPKDSTISELKTLLSQVKTLNKDLEKHIQSKNYDNALKVLDDLLRHTTHSIPARLKRSEAFLATHQYSSASGEYTRLFQLTSNMDYLAKVAELAYFSLYEPKRAMTLSKECLKSDPEHKLCKSVFKAIKKNEALLQSSSPNIAELKLLRESLPSTAVGLLGHTSSLLCKSTRSLSLCQEAVDQYPDRSDLLLVVIELLSDSSEIADLEKATALLKDADSKFSSERKKWRKLQSKVQVRLKQAKTVDYYKLLDVPRTATTAQIHKAYRAMAMLHHPDKQKTEETRKAAEEKMRQINAAYSVLKDEEKRRQYDTTGEDPEDPSSRQNPFGNGGDPFMQFFQKGGGGGPFAGGDNGQFFFFQGF